MRYKKLAMRNNRVLTNNEQRTTAVLKEKEAMANLAIHPHHHRKMARVDRLMQQAVAQKIFPGGVLLVSMDGKVVFFDAYGVANLCSRAPLAPATIFDLRL